MKLVFYGTFSFGAVLTLSFLLLISYVEAQTFNPGDPPVEMHGWAWSSTVGWISFNCDNQGTCGDVDYKVEIYPDATHNGTLVGEAWNDNVGWIKFGDLSNFPGSNGNAHISNNRLLGWARACVGTIDPDNCTDMTDSPEGWDGWISLNCDNNTGTCGKSYGGIVHSNGRITGYAWGGHDVVGWILFNSGFNNTTFDRPCLPSASCLIPAIPGDPEGYTQTNMWCKTTVTTCDTGYVCYDGRECVLDTIDTYTFTVPVLVRSGQSVTVSWDVDMAEADTCWVTGSNGDVSASSLIGTMDSSPLDLPNTTFTLTCTLAGGGPNTDVAVKNTATLPVIIES